MELAVYRTDGTKSEETIKLAPEIFEIEPNDHAIAQAVQLFLANQRQGTHQTKERGEVSGGGKKPWRQKGRGTARAGTTRSPIWVGGGATFGPHPRDYRKKLPQKVKQLARKSALAHKAKDGQLMLVEDFTVAVADKNDTEKKVPKTKEMVNILKALSLASKRTMLLVPKPDSNLIKSCRNIPKLRILEADNASTYDILNNQILLVQKSAVDILQSSLLGKK
jgi:large subunit ribosomal protein L4